MSQPNDVIATQPQKPQKLVWVISDDIPGHFNQSKGILLALEQLYDMRVEWISVKLKSGAYRSILSFLLNRFSPSIALFSLFYKGQLSALQAPDIVLGAGGRTSFAVAWLGQYFKAKSVFSGSLRHLKASLFTAVLILEHSEQPEVITMPVSPMPVNQQRLQQAAQGWRDTHPATQQTLWAVFIGGDGAGALYQDADWHALAEQLNSLAEARHIRWLISTSRRTGAQAEQVLQASLKQDYIADAVWWSSDPRPVMATFLGLAEKVVCSVDSMSMIMESVSAMRPVFVIKPAHFEPDQQYANAIQQLQHKQLVHVGPFAGLNQGMQDQNNITTLQAEPSIWLANQLKARL